MRASVRVPQTCNARPVQAPCAESPGRTAATAARASIDVPNLKVTVHELIAKFDRLKLVRRQRKGNAGVDAAAAASSGAARRVDGLAQEPPPPGDDGDVDSWSGDRASVSSASTAFYSAAELALEDAEAVSDPNADWADGLVVRVHSAESLLPSALTSAASQNRSSRAALLPPIAPGRRRDGSFVLTPAMGSGAEAAAAAGAAPSSAARRGLHPPSKLNALLPSRAHGPHGFSRRAPGPGRAPDAPSAASAIPAAGAATTAAIAAGGTAALPAATGVMGLVPQAGAAPAEAKGAVAVASRDEVLVQAADLYLVQGRPGPAYEVRGGTRIDRGAMLRGDSTNVWQLLRSMMWQMMHAGALRYVPLPPQAAQRNLAACGVRSQTCLLPQTTAVQALSRYCKDADVPDASLAPDLDQRGLPDMDALAQVGVAA